MRRNRILDERRSEIVGNSGLVWALIVSVADSGPGQAGEARQAACCQGPL